MNFYKNRYFRIWYFNLITVKLLIDDVIGIKTRYSMLLILYQKLVIKNNYIKKKKPFCFSPFPHQHRLLLLLLLSKRIAFIRLSKYFRQLFSSKYSLDVGEQFSFDTFNLTIIFKSFYERWWNQLNCVRVNLNIWVLGPLALLNEWFSLAI